MCKLKVFKHKQVAGYKISRNEEYLYMYDQQSNSELLRTLRVYNINTEKEVRDFPDLKEETAKSFGWSYDGKYLAKMSKDTLSIYETPDMHMLMDASGKRSSIRIENIEAFSWNKTCNLIAVLRKSPNPTQPSVVVVIDIPSRENVYLKSTQGMETCKLHWHPHGHMLAMVSTYKHAGEMVKRSSIGVLHLDKRRTEYVEEDVSEVAYFSWEPTNENHFAVLRQEYDAMVGGKQTIMEIYQTTTNPLRIHRIPEASHNFALSHVQWSPLGRFLVATRVIDPKHYLSGAVYGMQYFFYVKGAQAHLVNTDSHDNAIGASWDPSGRYYVSYCTSEVRMENDAFKIYNCFGETITSEAVPKLTSVRFLLLIRR